MPHCFSIAIAYTCTRLAHAILPAMRFDAVYLTKAADDLACRAARAIFDGDGVYYACPKRRPAMRRQIWAIGDFDGERFVDIGRCR